MAHERVLFERFRREILDGVPAAQTLLFPEPLELPPAACALLERWRAPLERLGFAFEGFGGPDDRRPRAVPALLKASEPRRLIEAAVDEFAGAGAGAPTLDRALAFVACRAAVKANTPLAREEMERLVVELSATGDPVLLPPRPAHRQPRLAPRHPPRAQAQLVNTDRKGGSSGAWEGVGEGRRDPFPPGGDGRSSAGMEPSRTGEANACRVVVSTLANPLPGARAAGISG